VDKLWRLGATKMAKLYYIADPMCSWCWGFVPELEQLRAELPAHIQLILVLGGLAADTVEPMPEETRRYVQSAWSAVAERTGARFNWEFWERCEPRRSTWPACRAVLAARALQEGAAEPMFAALQRAYYLEARNPSEEQTLLECAGELGLEREAFGQQLGSAAVAEALARDLALARSLGVRSMPSLVLRSGGWTRTLLQGYGSAKAVLAALPPPPTSAEESP